MKSSGEVGNNVTDRCLEAFGILPGGMPSCVNVENINNKIVS